MKIIELYKKNKPVLSLEVFPPRADYPLETVFQTVNELKKLEPAYISVTYGAGGSSRARTVEIAARIKRDYGIESQAHLTCVGHDKEEVNAIMDQLLEEDINNIMALRGDPPANDPDFDFSRGEFPYAADLIKEIKKRDEFGVAAAAHPEGHPECSRLKEDLFFLKGKVDTGVDFLISQLFFDNRIFFDFVDRARNTGINCPIVPGIMPVLNSRQIRRIIYLCGASIPARLLKIVDKYEDKPQEMEKAGMEYASKQIEELIINGMPGVHLYTMNKSRQINEIVSNTGIV